MAEIVAIISSPQSHGNTAAIVNAITDGAMGLSTNIIDLYRLEKFRSVHGCLCCLRCKSTGHCAQDDDITDLLGRIRTADVVIFSTPVYFGGPCSQYKMLEDRMYSFLGMDMKSNLPPGKKAIVVVSCGSHVEIAGEVADRMSRNLANIGFKVVDKICYCDQDGTRSPLSNDEVIAQAKAIGQKLRNT